MKAEFCGVCHGVHPDPQRCVDLARELEAGNDNGCAGCLTASAQHPCLGHGCTERCILHRASYAAPLTADTISDEQIRALRDSIDQRLNPMERAVCDAALSMGRFGGKQRARCAELINALNVKGGKAI